MLGKRNAKEPFIKMDGKYLSSHGPLDCVFIPPVGSVLCVDPAWDARARHYTPDP
jgi:hypothetical protein